jgi:hypothetical protein
MLWGGGGAGGGVKKCFLGLRRTALLSAEGKKKVSSTFYLELDRTREDTKLPWSSNPVFHHAIAARAARGVGIFAILAFCYSHFISLYLCFCLRSRYFCCCFLQVHHQPIFSSSDNNVTRLSAHLAEIKLQSITLTFAKCFFVPLFYSNQLRI